jgi:NADPH:quinone reductase-like Zn-dependent oxidoreductase
MLDDIPAPFPADEQVAVRVTAAGINPIDAKLRSGALQQVMPMQLPVTLGAEVSGRVEALGAGVTGVTVGQRVIAWTGNLGAYSEVAVLDANALATVSNDLDETIAAAIPVGALTAFQMLFEHGRLQRGETVLVHGASGGVGTFAVQLAVSAGASVVAVASPSHVAYLRGLGAGTALGYDDREALRRVRDIRLVVDLAGENLEDLWPTMKTGGVLVSSVAFDAEKRAPQGLTGKGIRLHPDAPELSRLATRVALGELRVSIGRQYAFEDVQNAIEHGTAGEPGKAVLRVA